MRFSQAELQAVKPEVLAFYLTSHGWKKSEFDKKVWRFEGPPDDDGKPLSLIVSNKQSSKDYASRVYEAITLASMTEQKDSEEILTALRMPNQDIVKLRLLIKETTSIPVELASTVVQSLRQLFYYGSASQEQPRPYFSGKSKKGLAFVNHCQFEQTFAGSFGFSISVEMNELSMTDNTLIDSSNSPKPFERQVVERIFRGVIYTKTAEIENNPSLLVEHYDDGFNGNMCKALSKVFNAGLLSEIECKVNWSPLIKSRDKNFESPIVLSRKCAPFLRSAYKEMAKSVENRQTVVFVGNVTESKWTDETTQLDKITLTRRVEMTGNNPHQKWNVVRVYLNNEDYALACIANGEKLLCSVEGELIQNGKFWIIENARNFRFVDHLSL